MEQLIGYFKDKNVSKVLDVGTGPGHFIEGLQKVFPEADFTGVDPDENSLDEARVNHPYANFEKMGGEALTFDDDSFDIATISMALHHLTDVQKTLSEMKRVVKSDGWIIVKELYADNLNSAQEVHKQMHHFRSRIDRIKGIVHNESFKRQEILDQIKAAGFEVELTFDYTRSAKALNNSEIAERKAKLYTALDSIKGCKEYDELAQEIPKLEAALEKHGFQMASRLVVVARVEKT